MSRYILAVDQSTQGTKGLLFDENGLLTARADCPHRQIVNEKGWVEHDLEEIWENTKLAVKGVLEEAGIGWEELAGMGISNQRETIGAWDRISGKPVSMGLYGSVPGARKSAQRFESRERQSLSESGRD